MWNEDLIAASFYSDTRTPILAEISEGTFDVIFFDDGVWRETGNHMQLRHDFRRWMPIPPTDENPIEAVRTDLRELTT